MLASTLRRNTDNTALDNLKQALLHTFATHIARNRHIALCLLCKLVNLIKHHYAHFGTVNIEIHRTEQSADTVFDIFAYISAFGQFGAVLHKQWHTQHLGDGLYQKCLARTGVAKQHNIRLFDFHIAELGLVVADAVFRRQQTLVVVVYCHRQNFLRLVLTDYIFVEVGANFLW